MYKDYEARKYVGQRIMQLRIDKGLTLEQLGEMCEMKPKAILRIEEGKYSVDVDLLQKVVKPMGGKVDIVW